MTKMDLDSSLDDIIKQKKQKKTVASTKNFTTTKKVISKVTEKKKNTVKSTLSKNTSINSRLGGGFAKKNDNNNNANRRADPSQIIITKTVSSTSFTKQQQQPRGGDNITNRLSFSNNKNNSNNSNSNKNTPAILNRLSTAAATSAQKTPITDRLGDNNERPGSITIRGKSRTNNNNNNSNSVGGFSIRGESGPSTVLLSNLDPLTTPEDVEASCSVFGKITSCDVLRDRNGFSYGEAEIKFSTKTAALDCIAKLDNEYADGRLIRAILRDPKPPKTVSYASKQIRDTLSQASGRMYADQMNNPRYDVHR